MFDADEQGFLTAIVANPDDDAPRLIYADWLDERNRGDDAARAAFIRLQCRLESPTIRAQERRQLQSAAKAILKNHEKTWTEPLRAIKGVRSYRFRRGFLDGITISATTFVKNAQKIFEAAPTIRSAYFPEASNEVHQLAQCEYLSRLAVIDLHKMCVCGHCPIHNDLLALFYCEHLKSLQHLNISHNRIDIRLIKSFVDINQFPGLTYLNLSNNPLKDGGVRIIGAAEWDARRLTTLDISKTQLYGKGLKTLGKSSNLPHLHTLILRDNIISNDELKSFIATPLFAQLTSLDLSGSLSGDSGAQILAEAPDTPKLQTLRVQDCRLTEAGKKQLKRRFGSVVKF